MSIRVGRPVAPRPVEYVEYDSNYMASTSRAPDPLGAARGRVEHVGSTSVRERLGPCAPGLQDSRRRRLGSRRASSAGSRTASASRGRYYQVVVYASSPPDSRLTFARWLAFRALHAPSTREQSSATQSVKRATLAEGHTTYPRAYQGSTILPSWCSR